MSDDLDQDIEEALAKVEARRRPFERSPAHTYEVLAPDAVIPPGVEVEYVYAPAPEYLDDGYGRRYRLGCTGDELRRQILDNGEDPATFDAYSYLTCTLFTDIGIRQACEMRNAYRKADAQIGILPADDILRKAWFGKRNFVDTLNCIADAARSIVLRSAPDSKVLTVKTTVEGPKPSKRGKELREEYEGHGYEVKVTYERDAEGRIIGSTERVFDPHHAGPAEIGYRHIPGGPRT